MLAESRVVALDEGKAPRQGLVVMHEGSQAALKLLHVVPRLLP